MWASMKVLEAWPDYPVAGLICEASNVFVAVRSPSLAQPQLTFAKKYKGQAETLSFDGS
jgi:hypothetical protein